MSWLIIRSSIPYYPFGRSCFSRRNCPWVTVLYQQQIQACMLWPFYFVKGLFTTLLDLSRLWITALEWWNQEVLSVDSEAPRVRPRMVDCANNWEGGGCLRPPRWLASDGFDAESHAVVFGKAKLEVLMAEHAAADVPKACYGAPMWPMYCWGKKSCSSWDV